MIRNRLSWTLLLLAAGGGAALATIAPVDGDLFPVPAENTITFWGHACHYIDVDGYGIVTDPVFEQNVFLRIRRVPAPPPESYAKTRVILISHAHQDHLSRETLATFPKNAFILCPEPSARYVDDLGMTFRIMRPGDTHYYPGGRIVAVPAHHMAGRWSIDADDDGRALGYVIYTPEATIYYTGDTNVFPGMEKIGDEHSPDIAIVNVSGHLRSEDVIRGLRAIRPETVLLAHHGAYGYLWLDARMTPHDYDMMLELLGPLYIPLELGESIPLSGAFSPSEPAPP